VKINTSILHRTLLIAITVSCSLSSAARAQLPHSEIAGPTGPQRRTQHSVGYKRMMAIPRKPVQLHVPKLGRDVQRVLLKNGMILYLKEEHRLPLVHVSALIRTGTSFVPRDQEVAMGMLGSQMRQGGTESRTFRQLNDELEYIAASVESATGAEQSSASLDVLSKDVDQGVKLFADVLMHPAFDPQQLEIAKGLRIEGIRRRNDEPAPIASRYFSRLLYTMEHPTGRAGFTSIPEVEHVTRDQLLALYQKYYGPNNVMMAVVGDFNRQAMVARLEDTFAGWAPVNATEIAAEKRHLPRASGKNPAGVFLIRRPLPQATVMFGEFGVDRTNPDRFALLLMNEILGGSGFTSRVMERVRSDEGLAYDVGTAYSAGGRDLGTFHAFLQTRTESVGPAIRATLEEIRRIREQPVSEQELQLVKDSIINSYIFRFDSPLSNVVQLMQLEYDERPSNYFETLLDKFRAVTRQDILRVARKYLHPDHLTFLVVGDVKESDKEWSKLGRVTTIPLDDPSAVVGARAAGIP